MVFLASLLSPKVDTDPSQFGGEGSDFRAPSTSEVLSAYASEAYFGIGTAAADFSALKVQQAKDSGAPITEEQYKESAHYRPEISYSRDMTEEAAKELAIFSDERKKNAEIISSASLSQDIAGVTTGFVAGVFEPKNVALGVATSAALTPIAGWIAPAGSSLRKVIALKKIAGNYGAKAAIGGVEGMVGAAIAEPSNRYSAKILQQDYTAADSILNISLSAAFGAGFNVAPSFIADKWRRHKAATPEIVAHEMDVASSQILDGQVTNVDHVELSKLQSDLSTISKRIVTEVPEKQADLVPLLKEYVSDNRDRIAAYDGGKDLARVVDRITAYEKNIGELRMQLAESEAFSKLTPTQALDPETTARIESIDLELSAKGLRAKKRDELLREKVMLEEGGGAFPSEQLGMLDALKQSEASKAKALEVKIKGQSDLLVKKQRELRQLTREAVGHARAASQDVGATIRQSVLESNSVENNILYDEAGINTLEERNAELLGSQQTPEKELAKLMERLSVMKREGAITEEEAAMLSDYTGAIKESDMKSAYDSLLTCMTGA